MEKRRKREESRRNEGGWKKWTVGVGGTKKRIEKGRG